MIYKIVQGNNFKLHILVRKLDMSREFQRLVDFDMSEASDIKVELVGWFDQAIMIPSHISGIAKNVLVCDVPDNLDLGNYSVRVSWRMDDNNMVSHERKLLRIVNFNAQSNMPIGIVDGDAGMFKLRYYIVTDNISLCPITYSLDDINASTMPNAIKNGSKLEIELTPNDGYDIGHVQVIMNGNDITDEVYHDGNILIPAVSGYVMIVAKGDEDVFYYGAMPSDKICDMDFDMLTKQTGSLAGKTLTIETTKEKPFIWFVSRTPVTFSQAGLAASLNHRVLGHFHYYWTDELVQGNDNIYTTNSI